MTFNTNCTHFSYPKFKIEEVLTTTNNNPTSVHLIILTPYCT